MKEREREKREREMGEKSKLDSKGRNKTRRIKKELSGDKIETKERLKRKLIVWEDTIKKRDEKAYSNLF